MRSLPIDIYRGKGILDIAEEPHHRVVFQMVGPRVELERGPRWSWRGRESSIVFIGKEGAFDPNQLQALLDGCVRTALPSTHDPLSDALGFFNRLLARSTHQTPH